MKTSRIISITLLVLFLIMLIAAFVTHSADRALYALLVIYIFLVCVWAIDYRKTRKFKALLNGIPAEHKLYGRNMMIFQTGYIRMHIERNAAGVFSFKSYLKLSGKVPAGRGGMT